LGGDGFRTVSQRSQDHFQYSFPVLEDIVVPEAQYGKACLFQLPRPPGIVLRRLGMLSSVQFDYELSFDAGEIEDAIAEGVLSAELGTVELPASQMSPKLAFGVGRIAAQCTLALFGVDSLAGLAFHGT
jgi:hypothetical protein